MLQGLIFICLSLGGVLGTCSHSINARLNASVNIDIPDIRVAEGDDVKWTKSGDILIAKSKLEHDVQVDGFTLFKNGTLQVHKLSEPQKHMTVEVHDKSGVRRKTCSITLIGIEPLSQPMISHTCNASSMEFSCRVARGQADTMRLLMGGISLAEEKSTKEVTRRTTIEMDTKMLLRCVATNSVSTESKEVVITCPTALDILLIACFAGAGVVAVVFLLLLVYCVLRCYAQRYLKRISEEEVELPSMKAPQQAREQRLPEPRNQSTRPPQQQPQHQPRHQQHPQPQPRQQLQQQRKKPQHKRSSHQKMVEDPPMMQQKMLQGQAVSQQEMVQGQAVSQHNRLQGQAVTQQKLLQGQAVSQPNMMQGQPMSQQNVQQGQPVPQYMVQVYPASLQQKTQGQLPSQHQQLPQLPPHHPLSVSQEKTPRPHPQKQPRLPPHRTEYEQHA